MQLSMALESLRLCAHERTPGIRRNVEDLETVELADVLGAIVEDHHLTRCAQVCFTGTKENQTEQHDHGTIDVVLGDQDTEEGRDVLDEADLLEQIPLPGHQESEKERPASWLRLARRARVATRRLHRNLRYLPREALVQILQDLSMPGVRQHKAETTTTQSVTTSTQNGQPRSGSRCVRDR